MICRDTAIYQHYQSPGKWLLIYNSTWKILNKKKKVQVCFSLILENMLYSSTCGRTINFVVVGEEGGILIPKLLDTLKANTQIHKALENSVNLNSLNLLMMLLSLSFFLSCLSRWLCHPVFSWSSVTDTDAWLHVPWPGFGVKWFEFKSLLRYCLDVWPGVNYLISLEFSFFISQ